MAGFSIPDSTVFEEWLLFQRERFARLTLDALQSLAEAYATQGAYARAIPYVWRQVKSDPLREKGHRQLMQLFALDGQISKALTQYETCRRFLLEEIGIEPSEETIALYWQIRNGELIASEKEKIRLPGFLLEEKALEDESIVFVDRESELTRLNQSLDQVLAGQGHVNFIVGEPGSGKTVLASEFIRQAMASNPELLASKGRCNAYTGIGDPYLPFREILGMLSGDVETRWAGGEINGHHARRLWGGMSFVIQAILENGRDLVDSLLPGVSLLAHIQSVDPSLAKKMNAFFEGRSFYRSEKVILEQSDLFEQYTKVLHAISHKHPLILIVDDLQWADPGSIGLLFHLGRRLRGSKILLIGAFRSEEVAIGRLSAGSSMERHPLETVVHEFQRDFGEIIIDLSETEGRGFIEAFIDSEPNCLDRDFRKVFYQHTSGHPLFSVELLRGLQARGDLMKDKLGRWIARSDLNWDTLPARVEAVIDERIRRLPEGWRSILAAASVEGEVFTSEAVARVLEIDEDQVLGCLSGPLTHKHHLVQAQSLEWLGDQRLSYYRFRHFLFQKYLYDQFDPVQRAHLHQRTGNALEELHVEGVDDLAVDLAWHFEAAGMKPKAAEYLLRAGNLAIQMFAYREAACHFRHGLDLVKTLPETPERDQLEISLLLALGFPLSAIKGMTDDELEHIYDRAKQLTQEIGSTLEQYQALEGLTSFYIHRLKLEKALKLAFDMEDVAKQLGMVDKTLFALHSISCILFYLGRTDEFRQKQKQILVLYESERDRILDNQYGYGLCTEIFSHAAWTLGFLGYNEQSKQRYTILLDLVKKSNHPIFRVEAFINSSFAFITRGEFLQAKEIIPQAIAISREHGLPIYLGSGLGIMGWILGEEGKLDQGIEMIFQGLTILKDCRSWLLYQQLLTLLADTYQKAGKAAKGLAVIEEALAMTDEMGFKVEEAELYRLKGELLSLGNDSIIEAEESYQRAISIAKGKKARTWELRATMSLCRLWKRQGKGEKARMMLSEIYAWFSEGFDFLDLRDAKELLESLS